MSLTFAHDWIWFDFLVHKVLFLAIRHVLALDEVKVISGEVVKFIFHFPDFRFLYFRLGDGEWVGFTLGFAEV